MILGIETATHVCGVGLADEGGLAADYRLRRGLSHAEVLPDAVKRMMDDAGIGKEDIEGIAVSSGPGSFTGLRIGMGFAKGLAMGWDKPMLTVPTMDGMVAVLPDIAEWACVLLRARKGEVYRGLYCRSGDAWEKSSDIAVVPVARLTEDLPDASVVFLGEDAEVQRTAIEASSPRARFVSSPLVHPSGYGVALVGRVLLREGRIADLDGAVPMYIKRFQGVA